MQQPPNPYPQYPQQQWQPNYAQPPTYYPQPQSPYGNPPIQNGVPPYSNPPYYQPGYGFVPPQMPSRSVWQSIKALPQQYLNIVNHPSTIAFFQEINNANWLMIWLQLGIMILAYIIIGSLRELFAPLIIGVASLSSSSYTSILSETGAGSAFGILSIIIVPLSFFFGQVYQYALAKASNGQGTFMAQSYTALLFHVPLNIAFNCTGAFLDFIPFFGFNLSPLLYLMWLIYSIILNVFQIKAVHGLTIGKALVVVLIPSFTNLCFMLIVALALLGSREISFSQAIRIR
jgi:hypothetical protein